MNDVQPLMGLYYPFIEFRSDSWIKTAALYWDRLGRIVPKAASPADSEVVRRLRGELDFVTDLQPRQNLVFNLSSQFERLIQERGDELRYRYGLDRLDSTAGPSNASALAISDLSPWSNAIHNVSIGSRPRPSNHSVTEGSNGVRWRLDPSLEPGADPRLAYLYIGDKMTASLADTLVGAGLGQQTSTGLVGLNPWLAFVYMHALAGGMASSLLQPVTDDEFSHAATSISLDSLAEVLLRNGNENGPQRKLTNDDIALDFALIGIRSILPRNIDSIPVEKIIEIRKDHLLEFTHYQEAARRIVDDLPEAVAIADRQTRQVYLDALFEKTFGAELEVLRRALKRNGIDTVFSSMSLKIQLPTALTAGAAAFGLQHANVNPVVAGTGALAFCLVPKMVDVSRNDLALREKSEASYLLRLEKGLSPQSLARRMLHRLGPAVI